MKIVRDKNEILRLTLEARHNGKKTGLVPTMGYLHQGHISLVNAARKTSDFVVLYVFLNPAQFNNPEDFKKYPVDLERDKKIAEENGVDVLYIPDYNEVYPDGIPDIQIKIPFLMRNLCAVSRPGHMEGVLLVLSRMFHHIRPDYAFFGMKDYQQYRLVDYYCRSLDYPLEVVPVPTVREPDGLPLSSRNARLTGAEREAAALMSRALREAAQCIADGQRDAVRLKNNIKELIESNALNRTDYVEILGEENFSEIAALSGKIIMAVAVFSGNVRVLDNVIINIEEYNK